MQPIVGGGKQLGCSKRLKNFHLTCLNPPVYKSPRGTGNALNTNKRSDSDNVIAFPQAKSRYLTGVNQVFFF